jgi:hypothetical protein
VLEKRDGEHLALVRSQFEEPIINNGRSIKSLQREQTLADIAALEIAKETVLARQQFYASREFMNFHEKAALGLSVTAGVADGVAGGIQLLSSGAELLPM